MSAQMKGAAMRPYIDWIQREYGAGSWGIIHDALPPEDVSTIQTLSGGSLVEVALLGRVFRVFATQVLGGDRVRIEETFRRMGADAADAHLTGVYSVFARFASPAVAFAKIPSILQAMFAGVTATTELNADGRSGVLRVTGLGELPYSAPRLSGWGERALTRFGAVGPQIVERSWTVGLDAVEELVFDVRWG